jgi:hypothetical protein
MITDYFKQRKVNPIITEYYELHRSFIEKNKFKNLFDETYSHLQINSSRKSCVCLDDNIKKTFKIYNLPLIEWTLTTYEIRNTILTNYSNLYIILNMINNISSTDIWYVIKQTNIF